MPARAGSTLPSTRERAEETSALRIVILTPDDDTDEYDRLIAMMTAEPLRTQWWNDAESRADYGDSYVVVYELDEHGVEVPAAWAGWIQELDLEQRFWDGKGGVGIVLRCCNSYVRHGFRDRTPELYALAYQHRHEHVVARLGLPAYSFLYAQPIPLHLADGWQYHTPIDQPGESRAQPGGELHRWWEMRRPAIVMA